MIVKSKHPVIQGVCVFVCSLISVCISAESKLPVKLVTVNWAPYFSESLPKNGFFSAISTEIFASAGYNMTVDFIPWARAIKGTLAGKYQGLLGVYLTAERKEKLIYSNPIHYSQEMFFKRREDASLTYRTLQDLKGYKIATVNGYSHASELMNADFLTLIPGPNIDNNIKRLIRNRVDLIVDSKEVILYSLQTKFKEHQGSIIPIKPVLKAIPLYIALSEEWPNSHAIMTEFNTHLDLLKKSGRVDEIISEFGFYIE